jgi:hypothetical protein
VLRIAPLRTLIGVVIVIAALWGSSGRAAAQSGANGAPAPAGPILRQNPLLAEVSRVDPGDFERILEQLSRLATGPRPPRTRSGLERVPSPQERRQLAANQLFAAAYQQRPDDALALLRETKRLIQTGRR